jgi:hypothetical protein
VSDAPDDFASTIEDGRLRRLYGYWNEKRRGRRFPARRDIDPLDFPYVLGQMMLIDVSYDPLQFRFRLYGSELVDRMGFDMTGLILDKHPLPEFRDFLERGWREVIDTGRPVHVFFNRLIDDRQRRFESLRLPLSSDGVKIDMLMVTAVGVDRGAGRQNA